MSSIGSSRGRFITPRPLGVVGGGSGRKRARTRSRSSSTLGQDRYRAYPYPQTMSKWFDPFPSKMRAVLRYSETFVINPTLGGVAHSLWRANSIFDPNAQVGGHQPYGHDTYQSLYNHYEVIKSVIKVSFTFADHPGIVGVTQTDDITVSGSYDTVREVKPTKVAVINNSVAMPQLTMTFDSASVFGRNAQAKTVAAFGSDPLDQHYFDVWAQANSPTADANIVAGLVSIVYYCEFTELKDLGQS